MVKQLAVRVRNRKIAGRENIRSCAPRIRDRRTAALAVDEDCNGLPAAGSGAEDLGPEAILKFFLNPAVDANSAIRIRCEVRVIKHARPQTRAARFEFPLFRSRFFKRAPKNALS